MSSKYGCTKEEFKQSLERLRKLGFKEPSQEYKDLILNSLTRIIITPIKNDIKDI